MKIEELLTRPEGKTLEYKRDLSSPKPMLHSLVAFANTAGGVLIIGRDDNGMIVGVEDILTEEERLANLIANGIAPAMMPEIESVTVAGKTLLVVRVPYRPEPFFLKEKGPEDGAYVRLGSTNRKADRITLEELRRQRENIFFDQSPCADTSEADLDNAALKSWFADRNRTMDLSSLESLDIVVRHGDRHVVSKGGMILFGSERTRRRFFPDARFSCGRFRWDDKSEFIDQQEVDGLLEALATVPKFIARNTRLASRITGMKREDIEEYPAIAIREVLVNAVAHADYSCTGMRFFVSIFSDRLEIQSPGMFPFGMTLENFKAGVSRIRNRVVCRVLHEMGLMEEWGSGYQRITNACRKGGYPAPEWREIGSCVRVIFRPHMFNQANEIVNEPINELLNGMVTERASHIYRTDKTYEPVIDTVNDTVNEMVNVRQKWFLSQLRQHVRVKAENIMRQWGVSSATAKRDIAELRKLNLIEFSGAFKNGVYVLKSTKGA